MFFFPKITLPKRIDERSSSLIDNIFTNNTEEKKTAGILLNHLSDHQIIFTYIEKLSYIKKLPKFITIEKIMQLQFKISLERWMI